MNKIVFLSLVFLMSALVSAQSGEPRFCGQVECTHDVFRKFPEMEIEAEIAARELERFTAEYEEGNSGERDQLYIIPVVFHIIHDNGPENISDEQIFDAVNILNRDFRRLNADIVNVVSDFQGITADVEVEFRLAQLDPDGDCTRGITRTLSTLTYQGDDSMKELIQWPRNKYMNIWVCAYAGGAAGYTLLPSAVNNWFMASQDGIVMLHDYVGSIGTSSPFRSRTLTHEVGHWLNLIHPWGPTNEPGVDENCAFDDNVQDTPNTIGWTSCILDGVSCGSLDNVQNYMEYSYCSRMFTLGQRTRMRAALNAGTAQRNQLWQVANLQATGVYSEEPILCAADFQTESRIVCVGQEVSFSDLSFNGVNYWSWSFGDGTILEGDDPGQHQNPTHIFTNPGVYDVTLIASNGEESVQELKSDYIIVLSPGEASSPLVEGFENIFPAGNWFIENPGADIGFEATNSAAFNGSKSLRLRNFSILNEGAIDALVSYPFDFSEAEQVSISYRWAYANKTQETDDRLKVSISNNCGEDWILKKLHRGLTTLPTVSPTNAAFTPNSPQDWAYNEVIVDAPEQLVSGFRVMFEFEARGGNNLFIDDINIAAVMPVAVSEQEDIPGDRINLYPNPAKDMVWIDLWLTSAQEVSIQLLDPEGRMVKNMNFGEMPLGKFMTAIDISRLSAGMYFIRWNTAAGIRSTRFVKN
jgi:PKD repeat protein